ncbi:MAG: hypothetical protein ABUL60_20705 [Myxococcales bacterium]
MIRQQACPSAVAQLLLAVFVGVCPSRLAHAEPAPSVPPVAGPASASASPAPPPVAPTGATEGASPAPAAAAPTPAPAAPPAAPPPAVAAPAVTSPIAAPRAVTSPGEALVHVAVSHKDAWLEMRSYVDGGDFLRVCRAPCDLKLPVEGREARVTAPGMTTSNVFRFDGGDGTAGVRVDGGSASARRAGILTLAIGIPVALAGMGLFAQGRVRDNTGLTAAGIAGLSAGGLSIAVSLPLLLIGTTHVKNAKGSLIALSEPQRGAL